MHMCIQLSLHHFWKRLVFPPLGWSWQPCWNLIDCKCWVYFWNLNYVILSYMSIFVLVLHWLDYCSFKLSFEIRTRESSNFVLVFQEYFGYSVCYEINISLSISAKKPARILIRITLCLSINLGSIAILSISSILIHGHLLVYSDFYQ